VSFFLKIKKKLNPKFARAYQKDFRERYVIKGIQAATLIVASTAKKSIQKVSAGSVQPLPKTPGRTRKAKQHVASPPGEPPNTDTGRLAGSVRTEIDKPDLTGFVGTDVIYGRFLELGTKDIEERPWLQPAPETEKEVIPCPDNSSLSCPDPWLVTSINSLLIVKPVVLRPPIVVKTSVGDPPSPTFNRKSFPPFSPAIVPS